MKHTKHGQHKAIYSIKQCYRTLNSENKNLYLLLNSILFTSFLLPIIGIRSLTDLTRWELVSRYIIRMGSIISLFYVHYKFRTILNLYNKYRTLQSYIFTSLQPYGHYDKWTDEVYIKKHRCTFIRLRGTQHRSNYFHFLAIACIASMTRIQTLTCILMTPKKIQILRSGAPL